MEFLGNFGMVIGYSVAGIIGVILLGFVVGKVFWQHDEQVRKEVGKTHNADMQDFMRGRR